MTTAIIFILMIAPRYTDQSPVRVDQFASIEHCAEAAAEYAKLDPKGYGHPLCIKAKVYK